MTAASPRSRVLVGLLAVVSLGSWTFLVAREQRGQDPVAEAFKGITATGTVTPGLFPIHATGVSTGPVRDAAVRFLASLTDEQRSRTTFSVDDEEWRKWNNVHRYARQGVSFKEMTGPQRELGFAMMRAGLSAKGFEKSRDVMKLNGYVAELVKTPEEYGEFLYHLTVMGTPSDKQPWGWQLDGHHLIVNYFVLGDQVVMTPAFMGSEPVIATTGQYAGTKVLQDEQDMGLAFMQSLTPEQQKQATLETSKTANNALSQAFRDNLQLDYAGLRVSTLSAPQRGRLLALIQEYVGNMDGGHARVKMDEVRKHLDATWFAWIGGSSRDDVFYYRIHSPVVLIEFDHQTPVALGGPRVPGKLHVHTVVRTPNGNDYGKDLLRQHYEQHRNDPAHGHR
ncbi:MAG TPA: DUF3500 domain-containing protein [Vicinamibacterales bacterium]|jgi:hypothetical protein